MAIYETSPYRGMTDRGMADHFPYDGIAEGASVGYRESAASTAQHRIAV